MFFVNIPKEVVKDTRMVDKKSGLLRKEQLVMICHPEQFTPVQGSVLLEDGQAPYPVGQYELAAESIAPGDYGRPSFRLVLGKKLEQKKAA